MLPRGAVKTALSVFVVALLLRLAWAGAATVTPFSDFNNYSSIAQHWLATGEFDAGLGRAYRTPAYPALLAGTYALCGANLKAVAFVQATLGALTAALVTLLAGTLVSPRTSLIAGLIQALSPIAIVYVPILASENLAAFLSVLVLLCLAGFQKTAAPGRWSVAGLVGGGIAAGLLLLTRPAAMFMAPAWLALAAYRFHGRAWSVRGACVFLAGLVATVSPWLLRNTALGLGPLTLSTQGGLGLWWGNNPAERTGGGDGLQDDFELAPGLNERQRDEFYWAVAWRWIGQHPARYLQLCQTRLLRLVGTESDWVAARFLTPTAVNDQAMIALAAAPDDTGGAPSETLAAGQAIQARHQRLLRGLRVVSAPLALLAFLLSLMRWRSFAIVNLPLVCYAAGLALTVFDPRYRLLSDPVLAVPLAALLSDLAFGTRELGDRPARPLKIAIVGITVAASVLAHAAHWDAPWYCLPRATPTSAQAAASAPHRRKRADRPRRRSGSAAALRTPHATPFPRAVAGPAPAPTG